MPGMEINASGGASGSRMDEARARLSGRKRLGWGCLSFPFPPAPGIVAYRPAPLKVVLPVGSSTLTSAGRHALGQGAADGDGMDRQVTPTRRSAPREIRPENALAEKERK